MDHQTVKLKKELVRQEKLLVCSVQFHGAETWTLKQEHKEWIVSYRNGLLETIGKNIKYGKN
jgi:hypothetical protein